MTEEFAKYKRILKREDEEFKEVMRAEVSISLPSNLSKQKMKDTAPKKTYVIAHLTSTFTHFF